MSDPFREQKIQNWAAEFAGSEAVTAFPPLLQEHATEIAECFLRAACEARGLEPEALAETDVKAGLLEGAGGLSVPEGARRKVPDFCAAFLNSLREQGRLAGGDALGSFVKALRSAYLSRAGAAKREPGKARTDEPKTAPIVRTASKLSPNDPCPCGSGLKFKKCCRNRLG